MVGYCTKLQELKLHSKMRLDEACRYTDRLMMGGTDCSLPWSYALKNRLKLDAVISYTDNETWAGGTGHVFQVANRYRNEMNRQTARSIVVATSATNFTINDPKDRYGLDVVGMDTTVPDVMSQFIRGE